MTTDWMLLMQCTGQRIREYDYIHKLIKGGALPYQCDRIVEK